MEVALLALFARLERAVEGLEQTIAAQTERIKELESQFPKE